MPARPPGCYDDPERGPERPYPTARRRTWPVHRRLAG
jgi:hypothetical protein